MLSTTGGLRKRSARSGSNCVPLPSAITLDATCMERAWLYDRECVTASKVSAIATMRAAIGIFDPCSLRG